MAHTFGKKSTRTSGASSPITTASFTIVSGETVLVLLLKTVGSVDRAGGAPTFNGVAMTQANSTQKAVTSPEAGAELWYLLNPPVGAFTCSIPNTGLKTIFYTLATGIAGAGKQSALDGANGGNATSTNPTPGAVTTTVAGDIGFAITAGGWTTWAPSAQVGTVLANTDDGADGGGEQYLLVAGTGSQTLSWTFATSDDWGAVVVFFKEVTLTLTQASHRLYADGTESGSTALAAQDASYTADLTSSDLSLGVRFRVQESGGAVGLSADDYQIYLSKNGGAYSALKVILDSYSETNTDTDLALDSAQLTWVGQQFQGASGEILAASFWLKKVAGAPTGNATATLHIDSGTFGVGVTLSSAVATSDTFNVATLTTSYQLISFKFSSTARYLMSSGVNYVIRVNYSGGDVSNSIAVGCDLSSPTHAGVACTSFATTGDSSKDTPFYVWYTPQSIGVKSFDSTNLTDAAATTNRLGAGTGSFLAGQISEGGEVANFAITASNYTEFLYSLTLLSAGLSNNDTLDFRVYLNNGTVNTYTVTPRITILKIVNIYNKIVSINQSINRASYW